MHATYARRRQIARGDVKTITRPEDRVLLEHVTPPDACGVVTGADKANAWRGLARVVASGERI
jgi:hypothetical protein